MENIFTIENIIATIIVVLFSVLAKVIYDLYGYILIIKIYMPKAIEEAECNFPEGHGDFKRNYVIEAITNICHKMMIIPNKKLFTFCINLFIRLSKNINVLPKIRDFFNENLSLDNSIEESKNNEEK